MTSSSGSPTDSDAPASQIDRLLDASLFAPLGLLLERDTVIPELAKAGRRQVQFARSLGQTALKGLLKGVRVNESETSHAAATTAKVSAATASRPTTATQQAAKATGAISGYDDLTARQIVALLPGATTAERAWVQDRERSGKKRVTILRALDSQQD